MKKLAFLILSFLTLWMMEACRKDKQPENQFEVKLKNRSDNKATVSWTELNKVGEETYQYSVFLNSKIVAANIEGNTYTFEDLTGKTTYECRIVAQNTENLTLESTVSFITFENYPPEPFEIVTDSITNHSVFISWNNSSDPEKRPLHYTIYVNNIINQENFSQKELKLTDFLTFKNYSIKVTATDDQNNKTTVVTSIVTLAKANALLIQKQMKWDYQDRSYAVYLPSPSDTQRPMLIYFHGAGGFAWPEIQHSGFLEVANENNFILVYPQASIWDHPDIPSWNVVEFNPVDDIGFVKEMFTNLVSDFPVDEKRVYASGMSSGGYMTYYVAFNMGEKLTAIAPVAGLPTSFVSMPQALQCKLPLMHIHGTIDATVSYFGGDYSVSVDSTIAFWTRNNGCVISPVITEMPDIYPNDGSTVTVYTYESPYFHKDVKLYKINNGGHSWPGEAGDPYTNRDFDVEKEIWNFFKMYAIN
jgi:polyhydroxybutyrate depolymerase